MCFLYFFSFSGSGGCGLSFSGSMDLPRSLLSSWTSFGYSFYSFYSSLFFSFGSSFFTGSPSSPFFSSTAAYFGPEFSSAGGFVSAWGFASVGGGDSTLSTRSFSSDEILELRSSSSTDSIVATLGLLTIMGSGRSAGLGYCSFTSLGSVRNLTFLGLTL